MEKGSVRHPGDKSVQFSIFLTCSGLQLGMLVACVMDVIQTVLEGRVSLAGLAYQNNLYALLPLLFRSNKQCNELHFWLNYFIKPCSKSVIIRNMTFVEFIMLKYN